MLSLTTSTISLAGAQVASWGRGLIIKRQVLTRAADGVQADQVDWILYNFLSDLVGSGVSLSCAATGE